MQLSRNQEGQNENPGLKMMNLTEMKVLKIDDHLWERGRSNYNVSGFS